jgi:hypothetical protein
LSRRPYLGHDLLELLPLKTGSSQKLLGKHGQTQQNQNWIDGFSFKNASHLRQFRKKKSKSNKDIDIPVLLIKTAVLTQVFLEGEHHLPNISSDVDTLVIAGLSFSGHGKSAALPVKTWENTRTH